VDNCTFDSNTGGYGGGIYNEGGTVSVTDSTFSNNTGGYGSGIANAPYATASGTVTVTNSTFSDNTTSGEGGAIYNSGSSSADATLTVTNCTFSGNSAVDQGGGIYNDGGTVSVKSTILASSTGGNCGSSSSTIGDAGYNISDDSSCGFAATTAANGQAIGDGVNPLLDITGLTDNGGPTETIALQSTSPAIDAIPVADCTDQSANAITTDQRGEGRPDYGEAFCDIGAFEYQDTGISFAGTPGKKSCVKDSVSALDAKYGSVKAAASALGYPNPGALRADIRAYCAG
jgi:predicted outer membrane repeat protein